MDARLATHEPVMLETVLRFWFRGDHGVYVDATYGRGVHSRALLERLGPEGRPCSDPQVAERATRAALESRLFGDPLVAVAPPERGVPKLELLALTDKDRVVIEAGEIAQRARNQQSAVTVHRDLGRMAEQQSLKTAGMRVEIGQTDKFAFKPFPHRERIKKEATLPIDGENQRPRTERKDFLAVASRHRQPPFAVECYLVDTSKHLNTLQPPCPSFYHFLPLVNHAVATSLPLRPSKEGSKAGL